MSRTPTSPTKQFTFARNLALPVRRNTLVTLMRVLEEGGIEDDRLAAIAMCDPALAFELLAAAPYPPGTRSFEVKSALAGRLQTLGPDLVRAYCLQRLIRLPKQDGNSQLTAALHAQFVAECAFRLAAETRYAELHEAYLAGLLHDVAQMCLAEQLPDYAQLRDTTSNESDLAARELDRLGTDHAAIGAEVTSRCGLPLQTVDAIHLHHAPVAIVQDALPLARLLWVAEKMAGFGPDANEDDMAAAAELSGLSAANLISMGTEVNRQIGSTSSALSMSGPAASGLRNDLFGVHVEGTAVSASTVGGQVLVSLVGRDDPILGATLRALVHSAFQDGDERVMTPRLTMATRLMLLLDPPVLLVLDAQQAQLQGLADDSHAWLGETQIPLVREGSVIAQAARTATTTEQFFSRGEPQLSAADWHLARRLDAPGILCEPWSETSGSGVAVFGVERGYADDKTLTSLRRSLVRACAAARTRQLTQRRAQRELEREVQLRYHGQIRRIVHEANNPIAVIKNYLSVIEDRLLQQAEARSELQLVDHELDRVAHLLASLRELPLESAAAAAAGADVSQTLRDLQSLYGGTLFDGRGIQFELRTDPDLPRVHISRDELTQVLVNLFRNASEALDAGARYVVSAIESVNLNGAACVEIRLTDNGPGIPPDRLRTLFVSEQSSKGRSHQGVGLVVAREILARNDATIVCESRATTGTVFRIYLPVAPAA